MCAVIDTNVFSLVFRVKPEDDGAFEKLRSWVIDDDCGKAVYGGTRFRSELQSSHRIRRVLLELQRRNSALHINDEEVDKKAEEVRDEVAKYGCNDEHIVALLLVSGVKILCSHDRPLHSAVTSMTPTWRAHGMSRPRIYQADDTHAGLLKKENIARVCK